MVSQKTKIIGLNSEDASVNPEILKLEEESLEIDKKCFGECNFTEGLERKYEEYSPIGKDGVDKRVRYG